MKQNRRLRMLTVTEKCLIHGMRACGLDTRDIYVLLLYLETDERKEKMLEQIRALGMKDHKNPPSKEEVISMTVDIVRGKKSKTD